MKVNSFNRAGIYKTNNSYKKINNNTSFDGLLTKFEPGILFCPVKKEMSELSSDLTKDVKQVFITTTEGIKLKQLYIPAKKNKKTVLFCHGRDTNNTNKYYLEAAQQLHKNGHGILLADYRGYGSNRGIPSEKGIYKDAEACLRYLAENKKVPLENIILWGHSLGGAVAAELGANNSVKKVILHSTFTNIKDVQKELLKKALPFKGQVVKKVIDYLTENIIGFESKFATDKKIDKIQSPILFLHSKKDRVIPFKMPQELAKKNKKSKIMLYEEGGHRQVKWAMPAIESFIDIA